MIAVRPSSPKTSSAGSTSDRESAAARRPGQLLLSLAIPTYNRASFLSELLEALLPQFAQLPPNTAE
ncbi:MAG TPA: hypothetical protein VM865_02615, partial [Acidobacteriaceae bacterium]|nr:hypothetical protein [Acidobacteriaceae bacterium]